MARRSLRANRQEVLSALVFEHPSKFPPLGPVGERDILLQFAYDEQRALCGAVHFVPPGGHLDLDPGYRELQEPRVHLVISYAGLRASNINEFAVQVVIGVGPPLAGGWPPKSYIVLHPAAATT